MSEAITIVWVNKRTKHLEFEGQNVIKLPEVFKELWNDERPYQIWKGSRFSAKSWTKALQLLIKCDSDRYFRCVFARQTQKAARDSQFQLFIDLLDRYKFLKDRFEVLKSEMSIKSKQTGYFIKGGSFENSDALMSVPDITDFWAEEPISWNKSIKRKDFLSIAGTMRNAEGIVPVFHFTFNTISKQNFIYEDFFSDKATYDDTQVLKATINYWHNPFCPQDRIDFLEQLKKVDYERWLVDGQGEWGEPKNETPWFTNFNKSKQVLYKKNTEADRAIPVYEGFPILTGWDFNYGRNACVVGQKIEFDRLNIIDVIRGTTIEDVCHEYDRRYGNHKYGVHIFGDASGKAANAMTGSYNYFHKIKDVLNLPSSSFPKVHNRNKNMKHSQSRELIQWIFAKIPTFIDGDNCAELVRNIQKAQLVENEKTGLQNLRKDTTHFQMDDVDGFRYILENMIIDIEAVRKFRSFIEVNNPDILEWWDSY